ncbi:MAG TPA: hypothetical protein VGB97_01175 [Candidatus Paceibacterota bacterium]|jgi:hypothetical protein
MIRKIVGLMAFTTALAGCGNADTKSAAQETPYSPAGLNKVVSLFEPYCLSEPYGGLISASGDPSSERLCEGVPFIIYQLHNGKKIVGRVFSLDRATGALRVSWSDEEASEEFYPSSSRAVPGKLVFIFNGYPRYDKTSADKYDALLAQYNALLAQYNDQSAMTLTS